MPAPLLSTLDDDAWDDLLSFIEERRVIPIIGPELLLVATDAGPRLLYDWLAEKLAVPAQRRRPPAAAALHAERCGVLVPGRARPARRSLRAPARHSQGRHLRAAAGIAPPGRDHRNSICSSPRPSIRCSRPPSTSSVSAARSSTEVLSYSPNRVVDLPAERDRLQRPVVYHLFGRLRPRRPT